MAAVAARGASSGGVSLPQDAARFVVQGTLIHSLSLHELEIVEDGLLCVERSEGRAVIRLLVRSERELPVAWASVPRTKLRPGSFLVPGFVDTHTHAPQYAFTGTGRIPLLEWLKRYTFPTEARFADLSVARGVYERSVAQHVRNGTTCCCYFATIHVEASVLLAEIVSRAGQRAFVGKVNMDQNAPEFYIEATQTSLRETERFVDAVLKLGNPLVRPIVTPRFAVSCTAELMSGLARIAEQHKLLVQSHISENVDEIAFVRSLFPAARDYTDVYDRCGLLSARTIMAHGVHLSAEERRVLRDRRVGISHCPNSNLSLHSGILDVLQLVHDGVKVGLGTDVAGGYSPSMLDAMRYCTVASSALSIGRMQSGAGDKDGAERLDFREAFFLATLGSAQLVNLDDRVGNFAVGKDFDALIVDPRAPGSPFDVFSYDSTEDVFSKFIFLGDDRNIVAVFVNGVEIKGRLATA
jgi:guanine deaminase